MASASHARPRVAISSCLLGERVRYDGSGRYDPTICELLSEYFDWQPICPEVAIGLGVPRPPVQLVGLPGSLRAVGVDHAALDITDALVEFASEKLACLQGISGYIFKSRSPSCGLGDVKWFDLQGRQQGFTTGLYAGILRRGLPGLPVIDERQLQDTGLREDFVSQVLAGRSRRVAGQVK